MRRITAFGLALLLCLSFAGCFKHTYTLGTGAPDGKVVYRHWHHHWLFGIIGNENLKLDELCPSGNATVDQRQTVLNGIINILIGIIYSPTTVTVRCADGTSAQLELTGEEVSRIVADPRFLELVRELAPERLAEVEAALEPYGLPSGEAATPAVVATR